jgi:hypothetical protein
MPVYETRKPLISLHIQKCGGVSFKKVLEAWYGENFYHHHKNVRTGEVTKKVERHADNYPENICIHGHFLKRQGFGVADYYPDISQFITILREPLQRRLSLYSFDRARLSRGDASIFGPMGKNSQSLELDEFIQISIRRPPYYLSHFPWPINENNYKDILEEHFIHIGVTEKLQDSVNILARKLGKPTAQVKVMNSSPRDHSPSEGMVERFRESANLEYLIYNYALRLNT